ncbi:putative transcription factor & chromatin remodeling ARID family [Helianthus anomalus]
MILGLLEGIPTMLKGEVAVVINEAQSLENPRDLYEVKSRIIDYVIVVASFMMLVVLMDQRDVEMEDTGKVTEDEIVGGEECSVGLVNTNPNEIETSQENLSKADEEETHPSETKPELSVDEVYDSKKDATEIVDDKNKIDDSKDDATYMDDVHDGSMKMPESNKEGDPTGDENHQELVTSNALVEHSPIKTDDLCAETLKNELENAKMDEGYESGTQEDQEIFAQEVDAVYREKGLEFKPPKFYGQPLNCLKLWRSVIKLGGYDRVYTSFSDKLLNFLLLAIR